MSHSQRKMRSQKRSLTLMMIGLEMPSISSRCTMNANLPWSLSQPKRSFPCSSSLTALMQCDRVCSLPGLLLHRSTNVTRWWQVGFYFSLWRSWTTKTACQACIQCNWPALFFPPFLLNRIFLVLLNVGNKIQRPNSLLSPWKRGGQSSPSKERPSC